ncbi:MAG: chemotaxis-specific protein-glutamate methyltransferase CheB [Oscillospiraceae bacterium]|nr:chemotaxis-specific protein-glutamate methyltransferase CheB [Oscillospiraceae bacterium]
MAREKIIRVLVVDDSILMRKIIASGIGTDKNIEVIGTAEDPYAARDKIIELEPDVITLDINMPKMDGIEFLKKLIPQYPVPVVVVSSRSTKIFDALSAGAVDFVTKPGINDDSNLNLFVEELIAKIKIASVSSVCKNMQNLDNRIIHDKHKRNFRDSIIAIGASTGGTEATASILKELKNDLPGILIVQHMPPVFTKMYADRLNNSCSMDVKEAEDGDNIYPGRVLIAAGEYHLRLIREKGAFKVSSKKEPRVNSHCPSVDVLFDSVAEKCPKNSMGIILTGMGNDGAKGLLHMREKGAFTVGQDEKTSVVYGMPMVAYNTGAVSKRCSLELIPKMIYRWANNIE